MSAATIAPAGEGAFPCDRCGAQLAFRPGTSAQICPHCGHEQPIPASGAVEELDLAAHLESAAAEAEEAITVDCPSCGARTTLEPHLTASRCPFCGTPIVAAGRPSRRVRPNALLPFGVPRERAVAAFRAWIDGLWFAPSRLRREVAGDDRLQGVYIPHWTYDCRASADFDGLRGDDTWVTVPYTAVVGGRRVRRMRQERRTRWTPASGRVEHRFDDVLVLASRSLPREHAESLEPWDLKSVVPYRDEYLAGFRAEAHQVGLADGFAAAQAIMEADIRQSVRARIGGDHQQILSLRPCYHDVTFKHLLLPVWISAYRWRRSTYRFLVNARTGEVQGQRPWSWVKIALTVLAGLAAAGAVVWLASL